MEKQAFLILAHDNFEQLKLLIKALDSPRSDLYIHIDGKSNFNDFASLSAVADASKAVVYSEYKIYWGDYSQTEAEIFLLEKAKANGPYLYYHLISNADFPIKPVNEILDFFEENKGKEFIGLRFPMNLWPFNKKPYTTEHKYYHVLTKYLRSGNKLKDTIVYMIEYVCVFFQFLVRVDRINGEFISAKGSQWWSITNDFASYVISKKKWIEKHFKKARSGDEAWPGILVYNSEFRERLFDQKYDCSNESIQRYIDWERGFPYTFQISDYDEIVNSGLMFVRKVDMRKDGGLVSKLYETNVEKK